MAEFVEVMKQAKRMCEAHTCDRCPLRDMNCECRRANMTYDDCSSAEIAAIERIVMGWAEKHPEPRYPSWAEWLRMLGVERLSDIIPAEVAEKLGIKPIGGDADA